MTVSQYNSRSEVVKEGFRNVARKFARKAQTVANGSGTTVRSAPGSDPTFTPSWIQIWLEKPHMAGTTVSDKVSLERMISSKDSYSKSPRLLQTPYPRAPRAAAALVDKFVLTTQSLVAGS